MPRASVGVLYAALVVVVVVVVVRVSVWVQHPILLKLVWSLVLFAATWFLQKP